jgi:hypothetical protein
MRGLCFSILLTLAPLTSLASRKSPTLVIPMGDPDTVVTFKDIAEFKQLVLYAAVMFMAQVLVVLGKSIWEHFRKKDDTVHKDLQRLLQAVNNMDTHMKHLVTRDEARQIAREEVIHVGRIQGRG